MQLFVPMQKVVEMHTDINLIIGYGMASSNFDYKQEENHQ